MAKLFKRLFDLLSSILGFFILSPLLLIIALLIKTDSKGGVFYKQQRVGKDGQLFSIFKFRSMIQNAENIGLKHRVTKNDSRITRVGSFLRKTSLDELPQLINVIKGDMSIVGPRPSLKFQADQYTDFQNQRLRMRPGITGLAQCRGRKSLNWNQRIRLDVLYVNNYSICLDFWILIQTVKVLYSSEEVYREGKSWVN